MTIDIERLSFYCNECFNKNSNFYGKIPYEINKDKVKELIKDCLEENKYKESYLKLNKNQSTNFLNHKKSYRLIKANIYNLLK